MILAFKYFVFAVLATVINLAFQYVSFLFYQGGNSVYIAMFFGTLAGLIAKYILDKKYIFYHLSQTKTDNIFKFILYSLMGILTTVIFWATELIFDWFFEQDIAKYIGAVLGLSIGYICKYFLDKKYVFK